MTSRGGGSLLLKRWAAAGGKGFARLGRPLLLAALSPLTGVGGPGLWPAKAAVAGAPLATGAGPPELAGTELAVALLGSASVLLLLLALREISLRDRGDARALRRVRRFVPQAPEVAVPPGSRSPGEWLVKPLLGTVGAPFARFDSDASVASTRERLIQAGEPFGLEVIGYRGLQALGAATLGLVALVLLLGLEADWRLLLALTALAALLGHALPSLWLWSVTSRRKDAMLRALPSALDILALAMEAGLAFDAAIAHVAERWNNPLSREFSRWLVELQMGRPRRQAMTEFAKRTGVDEVQRFVAAIVQAESMGVPVVKVLRDQAVELRVLRRQRAESLARTAPVKMLIPMVLFVFPALFIVLLGPAVARFQTIFSTAP